MTIPNKNLIHHDFKRPLSADKHAIGWQNTIRRGSMVVMLGLILTACDSGGESSGSGPSNDNVGSGPSNDNGGSGPVVDMDGGSGPIVDMDGGSTGGGSTPAVGEPRLRVDRMLTTLEFGERATVGVSALDASGNPEPFTLTSNGDCAIATASPAGIDIIATSQICTEQVTVESASSNSATLSINVIDRMSMDIGDGLLIGYVNRYEFRWNDVGSGGANDTTWWHPTPGGDGWFPIGSYFASNYTDLNTSLDAPMIVVRDQGNSRALAAPTGFTLIWNDAGSGADNDGAVWNPVCPPGFAALGSVATSGAEPPTSDVRCVAERYTSRAQINAGSFVYDDSGTGASSDVSVWQIVTPQFPTNSASDERAPMPVGFIACPGDETTCDTETLNLLLVPLPQLEMGLNNDEPVLTGFQPLSTGPRLTTSIRIPFTLIPSVRDGIGTGDSFMPPNANRNVTESPFYTLSRIEEYRSLASRRNQTSRDATLQYMVLAGYTETNASSFSMSIGLSLTAGGEASFLGSGGSWEATVSTELSWDQSRSQSFSTQEVVTDTVTVSPGVFIEVLQVATVFQAYDAMGREVGTPSVTGGENFLRFLEFPVP